MKYFINILFILAQLLFVNEAFSEDEKIIFAIDIIRHGDRTPLHPLGTVPYKWEEGAGQLTARGLQQTHELGQKMRKKYVEKYEFLPSKYTPETVYVRSSDFDRTLMSAQSLLSGLYPPGIIPVHTVSVETDTIISTQIDKKIDNFIDENISQNQQWIQKTKELESRFPYWSQTTGVSITKLRDLIYLGNTLYIHKEHGVSMPQGLSLDDATKIIDTSLWAFVFLFKDKKVSSYTGKSTVSYISEKFSNLTAQSHKLKFILLSAHDITIMSLLTLLDVPLTEVPPYASNLNFILVEDTDGKRFVKINYNDNLIIPSYCGKSNCTLEQFLDLTKKII